MLDVSLSDSLTVKKSAQILTFDSMMRKFAYCRTVRQSDRIQTMSNIHIYERVTTTILEALEQGIVPWRKGWATVGRELPCNAVSKKKYRGINSFLLGLSRFEDNRWLTFKQAQELGGNVKQGEKSTKVIFWRWLTIEDEQTGLPVEFPFLKEYSVFNVLQCSDLKIPELVAVERPGLAERIESAEAIVTGYATCPVIRWDGGSSAFYRPSTDSVHMPERERFYSTEALYGTLMHELVHSSGHESRLNRKGVTDVAAFGSAIYSYEELCAEFGACFLNQVAGIEPDFPNSASYIDGWLSALKKDKKMAVTAAAQAQKAADYILGVQFGGDSE